MDSVNLLQRRIILGSGRSGTTWVQDCFATANNLRPIFEPLHDAESAVGLRYAYDLALPGDRIEELEHFFQQLSLGHIHSRWTDFRGRTDFLFPKLADLTTISAVKTLNYRWRKYFKDRSVLKGLVHRKDVLIKCIRANLMAGWLAQDMDFRTVLIVRHPCAVVESQFRIGNVWDPAPVRERYRLNRRLHEISQGRYLPLLNTNLTRVQELTLNWVIENQFPVQQAATHGYLVCYYEHLLIDPSANWPALCRALDLGSVPDATILRQPSLSQDSSPNNAGAVAFNVLNTRWKERLTSDQLKGIQSILDATECDLYDINTMIPNFPAGTLSH